MYEIDGVPPVVYGPYPCKDGRKRIVFVYPHRKTSISYARYLMQNKLGRLLESWEEVDHKDENKSNDNIDNLQILTKLENIEKQAKNKPAEIWTGLCGVCGVEFSKPAKEVRANLLKGGSGPYCSKSYAGKVGPKGCNKGSKWGTGRNYKNKEI